MPPHSLSKPVMNLWFFRAEISNFLRILTYNSFWNLIWFRIKKNFSRTIFEEKNWKIYVSRIFFLKKHVFFLFFRVHFLVIFTNLFFWTSTQFCMKKNFRKTIREEKNRKIIHWKKFFLKKKTLFLWRFWKKKFV